MYFNMLKLVWISKNRKVIFCHKFIEKFWQNRWMDGKCRYDKKYVKENRKISVENLVQINFHRDVAFNVSLTLTMLA